MAKFFGELGYGDSVETAPGVWEDSIVEYPYYGDVIRNSRRLSDTQVVNDDITVGNSISIMADEYANEHFHRIRYAKWENVLWVVTTVEVRRPRLILELGGVYNGPTPAISSSP